jgi:hypothetical protein
VSYEVMCSCGQILRGERQRRYQVVPCPSCGRGVFVLPHSALDVRDEESLAPAPRGKGLLAWRTPLLVGAGSLVLLLAAFAVAWPFLVKQPPGSDEHTLDEKTLLLAKIEAGTRALAQGRFHRARRDLNEAVRRRDAHPGLLTRKQHRRLNRLQRQANLLARLSLLPLEEIVRQAMLVRDAEERDLQMEEHRGRSFLLDDVVRRDADGRPVLATYAAEVGDEGVRLALEDLTILRNLPLDEGPRLVFGARLLRCDREEGGGWVVRFEPDSGVLLTDAEAVEAASPVSLDPGLKETLQRQQRWLDDFPTPAAGRP